MKNSLFVVLETKYQQVAIDSIITSSLFVIYVVFKIKSNGEISFKRASSQKSKHSYFHNHVSKNNEYVIGMRLR